MTSNAQDELFARGCVIIGGASGIGLAIAQSLAGKFPVFIADIAEKAPALVLPRRRRRA